MSKAYHNRWRAGLSFTEVMFAVIVLGIGFIMVAALFPVAIQQAKLSTEDTTAAAIARSAFSYLEQSAQVPGVEFPARPDGRVVAISQTPFSGNATVDTIVQKTALAVRGNMIRADDPRFAWVPLYSRMPGSPYVQVFIFVVQNRNRPAYELDGDLIRPASAGQFDLATLEPRLVRLVFSNSQPPTVRVLYQAVGPMEPFKEAAAEGAYVVIANNDAGAPASPADYNGRVFRLGNRLTPTSDEFELAPGYEDVGGLPSVTNVSGFLIGRGLRDPRAPYDATNNPYEGPVQDIGLYTSFIRVNP